MTNFKNDIFSCETAFSISESSDGAKDGVLCKMKGEFFFPDGFSKNKRFYPKELWERAISNPRLAKKLNEKRLYGTISHEQEINDKAFLEGKISHIVTKLEVTNEGKGYGEISILDTDAGKILNTLARAGSKLFVSTRGHGSFLKEEKDGHPIVDPKTYILETVDFVLEPGFENASPEVSEALKKLHDEENDLKGDVQMEKMLEKLQAQNESYVAEIAKLREDLEITKGDLETVKKENDTLAKTNETLVEKKNILVQYESLGSVEELSELVEKSAKIMTEWKSFKKLQDSPAEITEALELAEKVVGQYEALGKPHEITEALDLLEGFKAKVDEVGTLEEITKALDLLESHADREEERKKNEAVIKLAKELNVSEEKIAKVYGKLSEEDIRGMFEGLSTELDEFRKPIVESDKDKEKNKTNDDDRPAFARKSLAQRLVERHQGSDLEQ